LFLVFVIHNALDQSVIGNKTVGIVLAIQRVWCSSCNVVRQIRANFTDFYYSDARLFKGYALEICRHMTINVMAHHLSVGWDMIKGTQ
jgi:hypothetical protein